MKETWKSFRVWAIVFSICLLILGVLALIWPDISAVVVCCALGALCIASGVYEIVRYFKLGLVGLFFQYDLALGLFGILAGLLMLLHPLGAATWLPVIAGIYMVVASIFAIQISVEMRRFGIGSWGVSLALGIINTIFAFFLILDPFHGAQALMIYLGAAMILGGIQNLYAISCISRVIKQSRKDDVIDVTWTPVE